MNLLERIAEALTAVQDPELHRSITDLGMVEDVNESDGNVSVSILLTISGCPMQDRLRTDITSAVSNIDGVKSVHLTFGVMSQTQRDNVKKIMRNGREKFIPFAQPESLTRVIGIASGKGGVGKSSVTVNLAAAAAMKGLRVGILDADVYGHSIPRLMGLMGQRPTAIDQMFIPLESFGVKCVSMEMFKPERSDAVAYRGPLLHRVLEQLLSDAYWGDLDLLLIDLPPGTGDLAISLGQLIPTSEILVVTTPQVAAAEVAERAGRIAHQIHQHIVGVVENMSEYIDPATGALISLFGSGGGEETAKRLSQLVGSEVALLGKIPFSVDLRLGGDAGVPVVISDPNSASALVLYEIAEKLIKRSKSLLGVRLGIAT
ncbi:MAG: ATP-binding protein involved in chromosome partitioning [Actinobacteria bacterium]|jgi:ATP-binding protein involved in chromosome partitioning|nr:ATP-binding protein involved in chromosome partitioning [Actinomycetota bacterium]